MILEGQKRETFKIEIAKIFISISASQFASSTHKAY